MSDYEIGLRVARKGYPLTGNPKFESIYVEADADAAPLSIKVKLADNPGEKDRKFGDSLQEGISAHLREIYPIF